MVGHMLLCKTEALTMMDKTTVPMPLHYLLGTMGGTLKHGPARQVQGIPCQEYLGSECTLQTAAAFLSKGGGGGGLHCSWV